MLVTFLENCISYISTCKIRLFFIYFESLKDFVIFREVENSGLSRHVITRCLSLIAINIFSKYEGLPYSNKNSYVYK